MTKVYRVEMNKHDAPNFSTAKEVQTKTIKYYDEEENVWKIGEVIVDDEDIQGGTE